MREIRLSGSGEGAVQPSPYLVNFFLSRNGAFLPASPVVLVAKRGVLRPSTPSCCARLM